MVGAQPGKAPKEYLEKIRATIATGGEAAGDSNDGSDDGSSASDWSDSGSESGAAPGPAPPPSQPPAYGAMSMGEEVLHVSLPPTTRAVRASSRLPLSNASPCPPTEDVAGNQEVDDLTGAALVKPQSLHASFRRPTNSAKRLPSRKRASVRVDAAEDAEQPQARAPQTVETAVTEAARPKPVVAPSPKKAKGPPPKVKPKPKPKPKPSAAAVVLD